MPLEDAKELLKDCDVLRARGGGPGGQHRNVTESRITLLHRPTGIRVVCDTHRSQHRNLREALEILQQRILDAERMRELANRPRIVRRKRPRAIQQRILEEKRRRGERKRLRRSPRDW